jgi:hypothetical protein
MGKLEINSVKPPTPPIAKCYFYPRKECAASIDEQFPEVSAVEIS